MSLQRVQRVFENFTRLLFVPGSGSASSPARRETVVPAGSCQLPWTVTRTVRLTPASNGPLVALTARVRRPRFGARCKPWARSVRWGVVRDIALSWVITLPASAVVAGLAYLLLEWAA